MWAPQLRCPNLELNPTQHARDWCRFIRLSLAVRSGLHCASGELNAHCWLVRARAWMDSLEDGPLGVCECLFCCPQCRHLGEGLFLHVRLTSRAGQACPITRLLGNGPSQLHSSPEPGDGEVSVLKRGRSSPSRDTWWEEQTQK